MLDYEPSQEPQAADTVEAFGTLFLHRLHRLAMLQATEGVQLDAERRRLLDRALYSTYWDCVRLGLRSDACELLRPAAG